MLIKFVLYPSQANEFSRKVKQPTSLSKLILFFISLLWITGCSDKEKEINVITFTTTLGPIVIELFEEEAPVTSKNFLEYAESGFFNGTLFHRVIPGFVIQGGGMTSGMVNKEGNPPIMNEANNGVKNLKWTLSMARTNDPHSASSQFFINLVNNTSLDHTEETVQGWGYAVFGEVVEGFETVEAIAAVATGSSGFHQDVPIDEVSIIDTSVTQEK